MKIAQPRNLKQQEIIKFFEHIGQRQELYSPHEAFRFKSILKEKNVVPARYTQATAAAPARRREPELRVAGLSEVEGDTNADADAINQHGPSNTDDAEVGPAIEAEPAAEAEVADKQTGGRISRNGRRIRGRKPRRAVNAEEYIQGDHDQDLGANEENQTLTEAPYVEVDETQAIEMRSLGFDVPLSTNGPLQGNPKYEIPRAIYHQFRQHTTASGSKAPVGVNLDALIDPRLLHAGIPTPRPSPTPTSHLTPTPTPNPKPQPTRIQPTRHGKGKEG